MIAQSQAPAARVPLIAGPPTAFRLPYSWVWPLAYAGIATLAALVWFRVMVRPADVSSAAGTMLIGTLASGLCAILGCYLVLRRMSLLGDAISHAVLPGIAIAFFFTGQPYGVGILLGAMALGMLTSFLTQSLHSLGRVSEDASMGVVFTSLFALGVILIQSWASRAHLDADCVLYGQLEYAWGTTVPIFGIEVPRSLVALLPAGILTGIFVALLWKELKIVSFDPALAGAMGFSVTLVHYLLMAMVAGVTVASFESVGSILVVAMLIVPAATAGLMTDRLATMLGWAVLFAATSAVFGYLSAYALNTNVAGMMATIAGLQFAGAVFLAPRYGLAGRWLRNLSLSIRIASEDIIGRLYREEEAGTASLRPELRTEVSGLVGNLARWRLRRWGLASGSFHHLQLTDSGRTAARNLIRAHRLWETYLETHFNLPADHLHAPAERMEHFLLDPALQSALTAALPGRAVDPHGKKIPDDEASPGP